MSNDGTLSDTSATVDWEYVAPTSFEPPLVWTGPYVECKLEHSALEPTCVGDQFFPDSVPYRTDSEQRIFYWRSRLPDVPPPPDTWTGLCATTHELVSLVHGAVRSPTLFQTCDTGHEVVVDGTIVGDSKTALVSTYPRPDIELRHITEECVEFAVEDEPVLVPAGERKRVELSERTIETQYGTSVVATAELVVRYPGTWTTYHPAPGGEYHLFPSFDVSLEDVPQPLRVPTRWGELDHEALAADLGIERTAQAYPERVLWQAFAYTAFEPNAVRPAELTQFPTGLIAVRTRD